MKPNYSSQKIKVIKRENEEEFEFEVQKFCRSHEVKFIKYTAAATDKVWYIAFLAYENIEGFPTTDYDFEEGI